MKIENHNYSIIYGILSAIVITLTPFAIQGDHSKNIFLIPALIIGDCIMLACIYLFRKGSGMSELPSRHGVKQ